MHVFIPFVFRPQVASESVKAVGPEGRNNPSRCREASEIVCGLTPYREAVTYESPDI